MGIGTGSELHLYFQDYDKLCFKSDRLVECLKLLKEIPKEGRTAYDADIAQAIELLETQLEQSRTRTFDTYCNITYRAGQLERRQYKDGYYYWTLEETDWVTRELYGPPGPKPDIQGS